MRPVAISLILLLSPIALAAQAPARSYTSIFSPPSARQSCPVFFAVKRTTNPAMLVVKDPSGDRSAAPQGQSLLLNLVSAVSGSTIVKASVTVHGMSSAGGVIPAVSSAPSAQPGDTTETFDLSATADAPLRHPAIQTTKLGAVSWLEITRLEYADGTTWQPTERERCTVTPSPYLAVSATIVR